MFKTKGISTIINTLLLCVGIISPSFAQVNVTNSNIATVLAQKIVGQGVDISNATMQCNPNQSGVFTVTSSTLGMDSGIVLTTGVAATNLPLYGVNGLQTNFANANQGTGGDADLTTLANTNTFDKCILEFDFTADGDSIFFKYKFGSEEYPAFNCSQFNDVFGFFITGPGYASPTNIALVPGTSIPVAINSVNNGVISSGGNIANCNSMGAGSPFTSLYVDNTGGTTLTYEGFTQIFKAKANIQSCGVYHLKLGIADGFDHILDSGVFLESGSLNSNTFYFTLATDSATATPPYIYEGCDTAVIKIHRVNFQTLVNNDTATIQILGNTTNGVDYPLLQTTYAFSSSLSDSIKTINLAPINDLITEGTETLTLILKNTCGKIIDSLTIEIKDPPKFSIFNNDTLICQGDAVQINGVQDAGLTFSWSPTTGVSNPSILNPSLSPSVTTTYIVTGNYGNCFPKKDTITVNVQPTPTITTTPTNILCNGANTGSILATGTVGSTPLTFTLNPGSVLQSGSPTTFSNLTAGTYTVTITSGLGCTKTSTATITQPTAITYTTATATNIACNAGNIGVINTTATGGNGAISYTLNPTNTTNSSGTFTGLAAGTYTVTAKDANNCTKTTVLTIIQSLGLNWNAFNKTNVLCNGQNNGTITAVAGGGTGTITYVLNPGAVTNTTGQYPNLAPNTYTVTATDASGCSATSITTITQPTILNLNAPTITNVLCAGTSTGSISITSTGGSTPITYSIIPSNLSNTTGNFNGIPANGYTITATDANGCTKTTLATITQPPVLNFTSVNTVNPICLPGNNGSISISATGGVPTYTYKLNTGVFQAGSSFNSLTAGTYTVTVKDANGCTVTSTVTLNLISPTLVNNTVPPFCNATTVNINVNAINGTPTYTYTLLPGNVTNTSGSFANMPIGNYTVNVIDANGCTSSIAVNVPPPLNLTWASFVITNVPCNGIGTGSIACTATNGVAPYTYQIMPTAVTNTTGSFPSLPLNTYTVTATDVNGCTVTSIANIIISPSISYSNIVTNNVLCNGGNTGSISFTASGGAGTITHTLAPLAATNTVGSFANLPAGTYTITSADASACTNSMTFTITEPTVIAITNIASTPPNCVPGGNGSITVTATGGVAPLNYKLNTGSYQVSNSFANLSIGTYTITVKDANNCTKTSVYNLTNPNAPSFTGVTINQANCSGSSTGSLTVNITGGSGLINYVINPTGGNNTTGVFNNLPANTYTITVTDANSCTITSTATIQQPSSLVWNTPTLTPITCNGLNNGQYSITATGGNGTINYNLMPGSVTNTNGSFTALNANVYTVTATDANGCTKTSSFTITNPQALTWNSFTTTNSPCYNVAGGSIVATVNGGTGTKTFLLTPSNVSNTTGNFTNVAANNYTVTVTDANGCSITSAATITQPSSALAITSLSNTIPTCNPGNNATITVTATGGVPNYLYSINGGLNQTGNVFTGIGVSTYTIHVADANGCTQTSSITVSNPSSPSINSVTAVNILCFGNNTGSITTLASGGTGQLSYTLNPGNTNNTTGIFNTLVANNYTITVTDANLCSATSNVILTQPVALVWDSVDNRDVPCFGGNGGLVTSSASGGTGTITYTLLPNNTSNTIGAFFGLTLGTYTLNAVDGNGCIISSVFSINQAPQISWTTTQNVPPSCNAGNNGTITVAAAGGVGSFTYKLQPGNVINTTGLYSNLSAGIYTVIATDANSCTHTTIITISQPTPVVLTNAATTFASCNPGCDGTVTITASGGNNVYTYSLNGTTYQASNLFSALCTGVYTVTIKDGNNCIGTGTFSISTATGPNQINTTPTNPLCNGGSNGSIVVTATGGASPNSYTLQPNNTTNTTGNFTGLNASAYTVIATDANGCTISSAVTITQPTAVSITSITSTLVSCFNGNNGTITTTATGGTGSLNYTLQAGNVTNATGLFSNLTAATYTIQVVDANGCSTSTTQNVTQPTQVLFTTNTATNVSCNGGSNGTITTTATGGTGSISYTLLPTNINNTTGSFINLPAGTYTIQASDANACSSVTTQTILQPIPLQITVIDATHPSCIPGGDATITVTATGGTTAYSYSLNGTTFQASNILTNVSLGTYTITVKDANNCTTTSTVSVTPTNSPIINSITTTMASCNPGCDATITVLASNGTGALGYSLNATTFQVANTFTNNCANTYTITVKDAVGCTTSSTTTVNTYPSPVLNSVTTTNVNCNGGSNASITLNVSGGTLPINYVLLPTNSTNTTGIFTGLTANTYTVTGTDAHGCTISTVETITQPQTLQFGSILSNAALCFNSATGSITAPTTGGTNPITYSINPAGTFLTPNSYTNLLGNVTYTITATDANGCSTTTSIYVAEPTIITINSVTNTAVTCNGANNGTLTATATGGVGTLQYNLLPNNITNTTGLFTGLAGAIYTVVVTDANGCSKTSTSNLFEPTAITINNATATNIICFGQINGTVTVNATGGIAPLSYNLQPSNVTNATGNFTGLSANVYTVTITDANGCTKTNTQTVVEPSIVHINSIVPTHVLCNGQSNGIITANASGGVGAITYTISPGNYSNATGVFNGLPINTYTITVADANGCSTSSSTIITQPQPLDLLLDSTKNVTCHSGNDAYINTHAIGGTLNYTYTLLPTNINSSNGNYPNLTANTYTMLVTDANGCMDSLPNIAITQPTAIVYTSVTHQDIICYKDSSGSITVNAAGGTGAITYSLTPVTGVQSPAGFFQNLAGGTYTVTATDASGCTATTTVTIAENLQLLMNFTFTEPVCHGDANGEIQIDVVGGVPPISFSMNNAAFTQNNLFSNLLAGPYNFIIKDVNNCVVDTTVVLTEPEKVGANINLTPTICKAGNDGKVIVTGTGGRNNYTYYIRPGLHMNKTGIFHNITEGTYTLTVKDSAGCTFDTLITILPSTNLMSIIFTKKDIGCFGYGNEGWAKANVQGGTAPYLYTWSTSPIQTEPQAIDLRMGYYEVNIIDANGCEVKDTVYIEPGPCCDEVFLPNAFSPNGDGQNDVWRVVTAAGIELIQLEIYDRWGNKVWSTIDITKGWNGKYKGMDMDMETYFYIFRYKCLADGQNRVKKGDLILVR